MLSEEIAKKEASENGSKENATEDGKELKRTVDNSNTEKEDQQTATEGQEDAGNRRQQGGGGDNQGGDAGPLPRSGPDGHTLEEQRQGQKGITPITQCKWNCLNLAQYCPKVYI